jgi:hypothetical protein
MSVAVGNGAVVAVGGGGSVGWTTGGSAGVPSSAAAGAHQNTLVSRTTTLSHENRVRRLGDPCILIDIPPPGETIRTVSWRTFDNDTWTVR